MVFVGVGLVLLLLKYFAIGPVAAWEWWQTLVPFGLAVVRWSWADYSGHTKRRAVERMNKRNEERKQRRLDELDNSRNKTKRR